MNGIYYENYPEIGRYPKVMLISNKVTPLYIVHPLSLKDCTII